MAKESPEEQLAAAVQAKRQALLDKMASLDEAASFKTLVGSCAKELGDILDGWSLVLDAIKRIDDKVKSQAIANKVAREFAAQNGLQSQSVELGHEPLVAHSMVNMSTLPWPAVLRPVFYICQFPTKADLWMNVQLTLNSGQPVLSLGGQQDSETIARALLNGMRPNEIQTAPVEAVAEKSKASQWFGFRPSAPKAEARA